VLRRLAVDRGGKMAREPSGLPTRAVRVDRDSGKQNENRVAVPANPPWRYRCGTGCSRASSTSTNGAPKNASKHWYASIASWRLLTVRTRRGLARARPARHCARCARRPRT
jgi:hypothetical protein